MPVDIKEDEVLAQKVRGALAHLPVSINTNYGDGFQPSQWDNTLQKLRHLVSQGFKGEVLINSKYVLTDEQIRVLHSIKPDLWLSCGLNGCDETKRFSMEERIDNYYRICDAFDHVFLTLRPIIPGRNDTIDVLRPMIEVASKGSRLLHHGGYRDPSVYANFKYDYKNLRPLITQTCKELGVKEYGKTCCLVSEAKGTPCPNCSTEDPGNLDVLEALGYEVEIVDGKLCLLGYRGSGIVTKGDVCFARHIAKTSRIKPNWNDFHENMSIKGPLGQTLICTSSWFGWSRQWDFCEINCDYCFAKPGREIHFEAGDAGCSPLDWFDYLLGGGDTH